MTPSPPFASGQTPLSRTGSSTVRCGRCGSAQTVDLSQSVLTQVRPFVHAHLDCGPDALTGSEPG